MHPRPSLALAAMLMLLLACSQEAHSASPAPSRPATVVLELFTSQGCSSCPPADRLLSALGRESFEGARMIPLAYHVDYWNYLGWRDPFSSSQWSSRQNDYARAIRSAQVYTPQLVVNGREQLVGSSEHHVRREIERQREESDRGEVTIERVVREGSALTVDLRAHTDGGRADLVVTLFENGITTPVASGENARRTLTNDYIVRWQERAATATPAVTRRTITIPLRHDWNPARLGVAAFLQNPHTLAITAGDARTP